MIQLAGVSKRFGQFVALQATDLVFAERQTTALIGPSGCGKSTLLRLIIGLIEPSSGQVWFEGQPVSRERLLEVRRRMGYVIQEGGLFPHLSAEGNILLLGEQLRRPQAQMRERLAELCRLMRLPAEALPRYPAELSGGMRQRVSLIRALMLQPSVLLLDEPLAALDPLVRADLLPELKDLFQQLRQTVVMVTHDLAEAAYLADQIVLLNEGRVIQVGSFAELRDRPADAFVKGFIQAQRRLRIE